MKYVDLARPVGTRSSVILSPYISKTILSSTPVISAAKTSTQGTHMVCTDQNVSRKLLSKYKIILYIKYRSCYQFVMCLSCFCLVDLFSSLMTSLGGGYWQCKECGYQSKSTNVKYHIEAKHVSSTGYNCPECGDFLKTRHSLNSHLSSKHRKL